MLAAGVGVSCAAVVRTEGDSAAWRLGSGDFSVLCIAKRRKHMVILKPFIYLVNTQSDRAIRVNLEKRKITT